MAERRHGVSAGDGTRLEQAVLTLAQRWDCPVASAIARIEALAVSARPPEVALPAALRSVLKQRARRNERLGVDLFRDPAWDMLLELLAAHYERRAVSVSGLCFASGVPATTALRYVERMVGEGLIVRTGDFGDQRRVLVEIARDRLGAVESLVGDLTTNLLLVGGEMQGTGMPPPT
jgi:DNA-binding MarR family transcriptional regulator